MSILGSNLERSCLTLTHTQGSSHIATTGVLPGCRIGSDDQNTKRPQHLNALSASNTYIRSFSLPHNEGLLTPKRYANTCMSPHVRLTHADASACLHHGRLHARVSVFLFDLPDLPQSVPFAKHYRNPRRGARFALGLELALCKRAYASQIPKRTPSNPCAFWK